MSQLQIPFKVIRSYSLSLQNQSVHMKSVAGIAILFMQRSCCISVQYIVREECFPTFLSWKEPCLCKRFTYGGEKKCNAWTVLHYCQLLDRCPVTTGVDKWNFLWYFKMLICVCIPRFLVKLL